MRLTTTWPVRDGNYTVVDPGAPVAVCTLTDQEMPERIASLPGVAIVGTLATANLGIERLVTNVVTNPAIGHLLVCGKDSTLFGPGQSLLALAYDGVDGDRRIVGATGFDPVLRNLADEHIEEFRTHINVIDLIGVDDPGAIEERVRLLGAEPVARRAPLPRGRTEEFSELAAGGRRRQPGEYDPRGFLVVTLDRPAGQILVRHYRPDNTPGYQIRSRNGEAIMLALLDNDLVTQLDHASYLGAELAKAEAALRLDLRYAQDRPLRAAAVTTAANRPAPPPGGEAPRVGPAQSHEDLSVAGVGSTLQIAMEVAGDPADGLLDGRVADPDPVDPYARYLRTGHPVRACFDDTTRIVMGTGADVVGGALLRVHGTLGDDRVIRATAIVVLTRAATLTG